MSSLSNSEDPDEMPHDAAFHQGLHCLLSQKQFLAKDIHFYVKNINCDPSIYVYTMNHPQLTASNRKKEFIRAQMVK